MKTLSRLFLLLLLVPAPALAQEYAMRVVMTNEPDAVMEGQPIDLTKESSSQKFVYQPYSKLYLGDYVTGFAFRGYNPGNAITRHIKVWFADDWSSNPSSFKLVYDGDYVIPSGGSEEEHIDLLGFTLPEPCKIKNCQINIKIECSGEPVDEPLYFECYEKHNGPVAALTVMSEVKYLSGRVSSQDGLPVAGAEVRLYSDRDGSECKAVSGADGSYRLRVEESNNTYPVTVSALGYTTYDGRDYHEEFQTNVALSNAKTETVRDFVLFNTVEFKKDRRATIILPVAPNPEWGRYYGLDRRDGADFYFKLEENPRANVPYVIFPNEDFCLNPADYDLRQEPGKTVLLYPEDTEINASAQLAFQYATFYGSFTNRDVIYFSMDEQNRFFDTTPDCQITDAPFCGRVGACRAYLAHYSTSPKSPNFIFTNADGTTSPTGITEAETLGTYNGDAYDLQGRRLDRLPRRGLYLQNGRLHIGK